MRCFIICTLVILLIFMIVYHHKETYVDIDDNAATALNNAFGEQPCSFLKPNELSGNALLIASSYVDANRIKKWNPSADTPLKKPNFDYCYINDDSSNDNIDYIMSGKSCSKSTDMFKSSDFITGVFSDNKPDKSRKFPIQKCVIEIDRSKLTTESLATFWNGVAKTECTQLNEPLRQENIKLTSELDQYYKMNVDLEASVSTQSGQIKGLTLENGVYLDLTKSLQGSNAHYMSLNTDLTTQVSDVTSQLHTATSNLYNSMSNLDTQGVSTTGRAYHESTRKLTQLSNNYSLLNMAYSNLDVRYADVFLENKGNKSSNSALHTDYAACAVQRSTYLSNADRLQGQYDTSSSNLSGYMSMFTTLSNTFQGVQADYTKTGDALVKFTDLYNDANSSNAAMSAQIMQLNTIVSSLQSQLQDANQEVYNIGSVQALNANNQRVIDSLSGDVSMYKNAYIDSMQQNTSNVAKTYDTMCLNSKTVQPVVVAPPVIKKHAWFTTQGDRSGNDLESFGGISIEACKEKCIDNPKCTQFNHDGTCWLKYGDPNYFGGSGVYYALTRDSDLVVDKVQN